MYMVWAALVRCRKYDYRKSNALSTEYQTGNQRNVFGKKRNWCCSILERQTGTIWANHRQLFNQSAIRTCHKSKHEKTCKTIVVRINVSTAGNKTTRSTRSYKKKHEKSKRLWSWKRRNPSIAKWSRREIKRWWNPGIEKYRALPGRT